MLDIHWLKLATFAWFAWVGSVTPGPNNALALSTAVNFGVRAVAPLSLGVAIGFSALLVAAGLGAYGLLLAYPALAFTLKLVGVSYLCWLGVQLARSSSIAERTIARAPRWYEAAALQYANPKAWMLAVATVSAYQGLARPPWLEQSIIALVFAACCVVSNFLWALLGTALRAWLEAGRRLRIFNALVGASLIATAGWLWLGHT